MVKESNYYKFRMVALLIHHFILKYEANGNNSKNILFSRNPISLVKSFVQI